MSEIMVIDVHLARIHPIDAVKGGNPKDSLLVDGKIVDFAFGQTTRKKLFGLTMIVKGDALFPFGSPNSSIGISDRIDELGLEGSHSYFLNLGTVGEESETLMASRVDHDVPIALQLHTLYIVRHITLLALLEWQMSGFHLWLMAKANGSSLFLTNPDVVVAIDENAVQVIGVQFGTTI